MPFAHRRLGQPPLRRSLIGVEGLKRLRWGCYHAHMETIAQVGKRGIISFTLPQAELRRLGLHVGDTLSVTTTPDEVGLILLAVDRQSENERGSES